MGEINMHSDEISQIIKEYTLRIEVKGAGVPEATAEIKKRLKTVLTRNPKTGEGLNFKVDRKKGEIVINSILDQENLKKYIDKVVSDLRVAKQWFIRCTLTENEAISKSLVQNEIHGPLVEVEERRNTYDMKSPDIRPRGKYSLLVTQEVLDTVSGISDDSDELKSDIYNFLCALISGEWEKWDSEKMQMKCWSDKESKRILFTKPLDGLGLAIWERLQSLDLLGTLSYPTGSYQSNILPSSKFRPHVVLYEIRTKEGHEIREENLPFKGILFTQSTNIDLEYYENLELDQIPYSEELFLLSKDRIMDVIKGIQRGLPLHLSEEQISPLRMPGPILLSGEAGSGKTIVAVQWLMINHLKHESARKEGYPHLKQLFVTYSDRLRDRAKREFELMLPPKYQEHETEFKSYRELLQDIARYKGTLSKFTPESEITFEKFIKDFSSGVDSKVDPVLLWDEIRAVIKGSADAETTHFLNLNAYKELSDKRGHCKTPINMRQLYYQNAQKYQQYLQSESKWDELDFVFHCISAIDAFPKRYDKIACDEVQDLAPIEIVLLVYLLENKLSLEDIFFSGDVAQVVNPSGFLWSRIKGDLGRRAKGIFIPDVIHLRRNYRSSREIVELVNAILQVRKEILDDDISHLNQEPLLRSKIKPITLSGDPLETIKNIGSNPDERLILVKNSTEKTKVQEKLGKDTEKVSILTIEEAKGLEWDGVLLYNFFIPRHEALTRNDWEAIFEPNKRRKLMSDIKDGKINPYALTYEFNLLHVGLTRARHLLVIYDQDTNMRIQNLGEGVTKFIGEGDLQIFAEQWKTDKATAEDLRRIGEKLVERDTEQAYKFFHLAAVEFEKQQDYVSAAECCELAHDFEKAAEYYTSAGEISNKVRALARKSQQDRDFKKAGEYFAEYGRILYEEGKRQESAEAYEEARKLFDAARENDKVAEMAIKCAEALPQDQPKERARRFREAEKYIHDTKKLEKCIEILRRAINEADKALQEKERYIDVEPINSWSASVYLEIAHHLAELKRYSEAAVDARRASGLWSTESDRASNRDRTHYAAKSEDAVTQAIEYHILASEFSKAENLRRELLNSPTRVKIEQVRSRWSRFMELYREKGEIGGYVDCAIELSEILSRDQDYKNSAVQCLKEASEVCRLSSNKQEYLKLLDKMIIIGEIVADYKATGWAYFERAQIQKQKLNMVRAIEDFRHSGSVYIKVYETGPANDSFDEGRKCVEQILKPCDAGRYCLSDVVLENLLPNRCYEMALGWIERSSVYFSQDPENWLNAISSIEQENKDSERNIAWIDACRAYTLKKIAEMRGDKKGLENAGRILHEVSEKLCSTRDVGDESIESIGRKFEKIANEWIRMGE